VSTVITLKKPLDNRNSAWVSLDGATRFEMSEGEELTVQGSESHLSMVVNPSDNMMDLWSKRLVNMFNWNTRKEMRPLQKKSL